METLTKAYDGDYEIIYSGDFNIYENKLVLERIKGAKFIFNFGKDLTKPDPSYVMSGNGGEVTINFTNFGNSLGSGTTKHIPVLIFDEGAATKKTLYFSLHVKSLNDTTNFLKASVTFYLK